MVCGMAGTTPVLLSVLVLLVTASVGHAAAPAGGLGPERRAGLALPPPPPPTRVAPVARMRSVAGGGLARTRAVTARPLLAGAARTPPRAPGPRPRRAAGQEGADDDEDKPICRWDDSGSPAGTDCTPKTDPTLHNKAYNDFTRNQESEWVAFTQRNNVVLAVICPNHGAWRQTARARLDQGEPAATRCHPAPSASAAAARDKRGAPAEHARRQSGPPKPPP